MTHTDILIQRAINMVQQADYAVALTGAGISTPSGIPDFRSPKSGVWDKVDPTEVATIHAFRRRPQAFYDWIHPLAKTIADADPNPAHFALARLEAAGPLRAIVTQNIDQLHTRAGSEVVYEVHGHMRTATCLQCFGEFQADVALADFLATGSMPMCPECSGVLKPDVILFGEMLPVQVLTAAQRAVRECDLLIVAGSSLAVAPAGDLPLLAKQNGAQVVIVNKSSTHLDPYADITIRGDVAEVLPQFAASFAAAQPGTD